MLAESNVGQLRGISRKIVAWSKLHPFKLSAVLLCVLILGQVAILPFGEINGLAKINPRTTAFMEERASFLRSEGKQFRKLQSWVPLKEIPQDVVNAVIVAEDGTFWSHHGFDWYEVKESIERNIDEGRAARGASTITQQLVKNLFLSSSKNPARKLKEWILTWWMETRLSKSRILEIYLNVIEWGNGVYGIEAASIYHFGKPVTLLTRVEAARLAAIIPDPRSYMANSDSHYVERRSTLILERMEARGN